jgi:hypothetical protein
MPVAFYPAWLPRSFTFNALGDITAASPGTRAFGDYLSSSSAAFAEAMAPKGEADPPPVDWDAAGFFIIFFTFAVTA